MHGTHHKCSAANDAILQQSLVRQRQHRHRSQLPSRLCPKLADSPRRRGACCRDSPARRASLCTAVATSSTSSWSAPCIKSRDHFRNEPSGYARFPGRQRLGPRRMFSASNDFRTREPFVSFVRAAPASTSASTTARTHMMAVPCLVIGLARTGLSFRIRRVEAFTRKEARSTLLPRRPHTLEKTASHPPGAPSCYKKLQTTRRTPRRLRRRAARSRKCAAPGGPR